MKRSFKKTKASLKLTYYKKINKMAHEIELIVSLRKQGDYGVKKRGDVLSCRLRGGRWGEKELKSHQVVLWPSDSPTEDELLAKQILLLILNKKLKSEKNPRVDFPFCEVVDEIREDDSGEPIELFPGKPETQRVITNRSIIHFDFSNLDPEKIEDIFDEETIAEPIKSEDLLTVIDQRGIDKREPSERGNKEHREILDKDPVLHAETALRRNETINIQEFLGE